MDELPSELLEIVLSCVPEYRRVFAQVCRGWRDAVARRGVAKREMWLAAAQ